VLRLLPLAERRLVVVLAVLALASGLLPLVLTLSIGVLTAEIPKVVGDGFDSEAGQRLVWILAVATGAFAALQALTPLRGVLTLIVGRQIDEAIRARTLEDLLRPDRIAHLEDPTLQDHLTVIREGSTSREARPGGAAVATVWLLDVYVRSLGATVFVGIAFAWWAAVGLLGVCLLARRIIRRADFAFLWAIVDANRLRIRRRTDYDEKMGIGPATAKETRVFGLTGWIGDRFGADWDEAVWPIHHTRNRLTRSLGVAGGLVLVTFVTVFALAADAAVAGRIGLGALAIVVRSSFDLAELARGGPWDWELELGTGVLPKVKELHARAERAATSAGTERPSHEIPRDEIRFEEVGFKYPGSDRDVLRGLDLSIPAGRSVAIVGPNGVGKTTLVKVLAGLYEPTEGRILVDDIDLMALDPGHWHQQIAVIFQDFVRYELPARENVGFGSVIRLDDRDALTRAAAKSGADAVIEALPHGWDTVLSRQYTMGADLSGGEWQRVALARCHLAIEAGARILVLDEPTASLDVREEARFFDRFVELTEGLTTIIISHRFSTVRAASRIVVLDEGRILEDGSHDELVALDGTYAEMFRLQAGRYRADTESDSS
jgi:ABC-type multidrug transport system fused ATPase/permease subunit